MKFKRIKQGQFTKAKCHNCKTNEVEFTHGALGYCVDCKKKMQQAERADTSDDSEREWYNMHRSEIEF